MARPEPGAGQILIVGRNSFLAGQVLGVLPAERVRAVGHDAIDRPDLLDAVACVVNFARHPLLGSEHYRPESMDADLRLARRIGTREIAYVMLSSRKVYAPGARPFAETWPTGPSDAYGRAKLAAEQGVQELLGERLTVLRLANVFGYERIAGRRTFLAQALERLEADGEIRYDMSPFVIRDFLPVAIFASLLAQIAQAPPGGILNLGSGIGLPTGRLALWILEGFARGRLVITSPREHDAFVLDIARLRRLYGAPCSLGELRRTCLEIGRRLAAELEDRQDGRDPQGRSDRT
jgi:UDP-glucose 4-epimerase